MELRLGSSFPQTPSLGGERVPKIPSDQLYDKKHQPLRIYTQFGYP